MAAFIPTPHSTTPGPTLQPGGSLQQQAAQLGQGGPVQPNMVNQQNVTVKKADDMLNLVNSLAAREDIATGQQLQRQGQGMMYTPRYDGDDWRSVLAGTLRDYRGEKKVDAGIEAEGAYQDAMKEEAQRKQELKARAAGQHVLANGGTQEQADAAYYAVLHELDTSKLATSTGPDRMELFNMRDKIIDDAKKSMQFILDGDSRLEQLNLITAEGYDSGAAQIASLYALIKDLDPGSVVREGEVALAQQAESIIGSLEKLAIKAKSSGVMSPAMFEDIVKFTRDLNAIQRESARKGMAQHVERAATEGFKVAEVWGPTFADWWESEDAPVSSLSTAKSSLPVFNSPDEVRAAVADGTLKPGDKFTNADGEELMVPGG